MQENIETPFGNYRLKPGEELEVFDDQQGLSIISDYREMQFPGRKMMIKITRRRPGSDEVIGSVNMIEHERKSSSGYPIVDPYAENLPVVNYSFHADEGVRYDEAKKVFSYRDRGRKKSLTEFADTLAANHQNPSHKLSRLAQRLPGYLLSCLFWIVDLSYKKDAGVEDIFKDRGEKVTYKGKVNDQDLFFRYFKISKNLLLIFLVTTGVIIAIVQKFAEGSVLNIQMTSIFVIIVIAIPLFILEKITVAIITQIEDFKNGKDNRIRNLHLKRYGWTPHQFDLDWEME